MTSPVDVLEHCLKRARPILWGCAAAGMIGLAVVGFTGYLFWSTILD